MLFSCSDMLDSMCQCVVQQVQIRYLSNSLGHPWPWLTGLHSVCLCVIFFLLGGLVSRNCSRIEKDTVKLSLTRTAACPSRPCSTFILRCSSAANTVSLSVNCSVNLRHEDQCSVCRCKHLCVFCMIITVIRMLTLFIVSVCKKQKQNKTMSPPFPPHHHHSFWRWWSGSWLRELPAAWMLLPCTSQRSSGWRVLTVGVWIARVCVCCNWAELCVFRLRPDLWQKKCKYKYADLPLPQIICLPLRYKANHS